MTSISLVSDLLNNRRFGSSFNYEEGMEELRQKMRFLESKLGISKPADLSVGAFNSSPCAKFATNSIQIPAWFLFRHDDIPAEFQVANITDPRITDRGFLNTLATWMNHKIGQAGLTTICRPVDLGTLQFFVQLLRDRALYEKCRDFAIGHELAHLAHSLQREHAIMLEDIQASFSAAGITVGIFLLAISVAFLPIINVALTLTVTGIAVVISGVSLIAWVNHTQVLPFPSDTQEEKNADLDSVKALQDARGAIYYFQTSRLRHLALRNADSSWASSIDVAGNNLRDTKHPPLSERIAYLQTWQSEHLGRC